MTAARKCLNCPMAKPAVDAARALENRTNEITNYPWWFIIFGTTPRKINEIPFRMVGPFFNRADAEAYRKAKIYDFGEKSFVHCASGYESDVYIAAVDAARKLLSEN